MCDILKKPLPHGRIKRRLIVCPDMNVLAGLFIANENVPFAAVYPRGGVIYGKFIACGKPKIY
jgi:hypothetical protein